MHFPAHLTSSKQKIKRFPAREFVSATLCCMTGLQSHLQCPLIRQSWLILELHLSSKAGREKKQTKTN